MMQLRGQWLLKIRNRVVSVMTLLFGMHNIAYAEEMNLGDVAMNLTETLYSLSTLMLFGINLIGLAFGVSGIMKLKHHKDNPSAVPLNQPIVLIILSGVLLFYPVLIKVVEEGVFFPR